MYWGKKIPDIAMITSEIAYVPHKFASVLFQKMYYINYGSDSCYTVFYYREYYRFFFLFQ